MHGCLANPVIWNRCAQVFAKQLHEQAAMGAMCFAVTHDLTRFIVYDTGVSALLPGDQGVYGFCFQGSRMHCNMATQKFCTQGVCTARCCANCL